MCSQAFYSAASTKSALMMEGIAKMKIPLIFYVMESFIPEQLQWPHGGEVYVTVVNLTAETDEADENHEEISSRDEIHIHKNAIANV